jgi:hypothetical protein
MKNLGGDTEEMKEEGSWRTAPDNWVIAVPTLLLTRRTLSKDLSSFNKPKTKLPLFSGPEPS